MLTTDAFLGIIDAAKGSVSDAALSRKAGLASKAVRGIREGKRPSLDRAAALADALGLEVVVRIKGQLVDPLAFRMAVVSLLALKEGEDDDEMLEMFLDGLASAYDYWAEFFAKHGENREATYRAARAAMGDVRDKRPSFAARRDGVIEWMQIVATAQDDDEGGADDGRADE